MDKYALIQQKLDSFFQIQATNYKISAEKLKMIISFDGIKLKYELWDANNQFKAYKKIDEILNLSFIEKAFTSNSKVENTLMETINKIANENQAQAKEVQLLLYPNKTYSALKNRAKIKEIKLNEIV